MAKAKERSKKTKARERATAKARKTVSRAAAPPKRRRRRKPRTIVETVGDAMSQAVDAVIGR